MVHKHSILLYLGLQFLVAGNSQGEDGARASCMTYGFISVLYGSEQNITARVNLKYAITIKQHAWH